MMETLKSTALAEHFNLFGEGISVLENGENLLWIEDQLESSTNPEDATFHTRYLFMLPDNMGISGEELGKIIEEAREQKIPVRKYLPSKIPEVKIVSEIAPGPGVIDKKTRNKRNTSSNLLQDLIRRFRSKSLLKSKSSFKTSRVKDGRLSFLGRKNQRY